MSTNGKNVSEDAEMSDCDGEKVVTMMDVLKEQEDFEEDAHAVLGASDDKNCTYSKGYVKRQAIYACMTCTDVKNDPSKWAGICLACSLTCHENHELIELYTKRNFRCDCGNPKFNSHPCQFTPNKTDFNVENTYNQNFSGLYCICHRPYPDPESSMQGDMIQCIICEDWLHSNHLDAVVPPNEQYSEMICKLCMDKNEFLHDYSDLAVNKKNMDVDILNTSLDINAPAICDDSDMEMAGHENIGTCNNDDLLNEQTENDDAAVAKTYSESETEKIEQSGTSAESEEKQDFISKEQQSNSIDGVTSNELTETKSTLNEANLCELDTVKKTETEQKGTKLVKTSLSIETTQETVDSVKNQSSLIEQEATTITKTATHDNRSQEQVEEDLLLADPMETDSNKKDNISDVTSSDANQCNTTENKPGPEQMETSEFVSDSKLEETKDKEVLKNESESSNAPHTEHSGSIAIVETLKNLNSSEESANVATTKESESIVIATEELHNIITKEQAENITQTVEQTDESQVTKQDVTAIGKSELEETESVPNIENSKCLSTSEQTMAANISEEEENISTLKESENNSDNESEHITIIKQSGIIATEKQLHHDYLNNEKNVYGNNTGNEADNNSIKKDNFTHIMDNTTNDAINNESQKDDEINSISAKEISEETTDILKRKFSSDGDVETIEVKKPKLEGSKCVRPRDVKKNLYGATFWPSNFRYKLCTCNECILMYKDLSVLFLVDPEDTVTAYERLGKEKTDGKPASQYEKGMEALSSLGRVQQINALTEYAKLRDKLLDYLKTFKDKKIIVKEEDIKAFFADMKPKREPDGVYFCR